MSLKREFVRLLVIAVLCLLLLPVLTFLFAGHGLERFSGEIREALISDIESVEALPADRKSALLAEVGAMDAQGLCRGDYPDLAEVAAQLCGWSGDIGQFLLARQLALFALALGLASFAAIAGLAWLAYQKPSRQVQAFTAGWWSLRLIAAVEVVLQASMLVWLSTGSRRCSSTSTS